MQKCVIIINGTGGVGKDTLCSMAGRQFRVRTISSITPIKEIATQAGWNGRKDPKSRKLLSDLKRIFTEYNDLPTRYLLSELESFRSSDEELLFVHIREPEEIDHFKRQVRGIRCVTLLVTRKATEGRHWGNASDDEVKNYHYDYLYRNDLPLDRAGGNFCAFLRKHVLRTGNAQSRGRRPAKPSSSQSASEETP